MIVTVLPAAVTEAMDNRVNAGESVLGWCVCALVFLSLYLVGVLVGRSVG